MIFPIVRLHVPVAILFGITLCMVSQVWSQDQTQPEQPSADQNVGEETPAQEDIQERGIPKFPGLQRRPVPPSPSGSPPAPSQPRPPSTAPSNAPIPLAGHPQGQQMMATAVKNASLLDIDFTFLDKTYKNDVYGPRDPISGKRIRLSCVRLKVTSGFKFRVDVPQFTLTNQGLTVTQNISRISNNGIKIKWQLGPCFEHAGGFGFSLSDVKFVYKARPLLALDGNGVCRLVWNNDPNQLRVAIGDLNIMGVQNDLDKLAKDAVREAANLTFDAVFGALLQRELRKVTIDVCGGLKIGNK